MMHANRNERREEPYRTSGSSYSTERTGGYGASRMQHPYSHLADSYPRVNPVSTGGAGAHGARATSSRSRRAARSTSGRVAKTVLCGVLGAATACAIGFGGTAAFDALSSSATPAFAVTESGVTAGSTSDSGTDSATANAVNESQTIGETVAAKVLPSVVAVYNYQQGQASYGYGYGAAAASDELQATGMGSGVVISDDGCILTNYHVVEGASKLTVKVGNEEREATYVGGDSSSDVAVLKVENADGLVPVEIGDSDSLNVGEWVMTVGAPLGLEQSVATGVVSATNRSTVMDDSSSDGYGYYNAGMSEYTYYPNMIQTDAMINPGNSGGALVDADGKLIGINTMISSSSGNYAGVGFAIPVNYAMGIAEDILAGKEPSHAMLGVSVSTVNASNAQRYGLPVSAGAYVNAVASGSSLQAGDIITAIDGNEVSSATDVTLEVRSHNAGDTVTVTVNRGGETVDVQVTLGSDSGTSVL